MFIYLLAKAQRFFLDQSFLLAACCGPHSAKFLVEVCVQFKAPRTWLVSCFRVFDPDWLSAWPPQEILCLDMTKDLVAIIWWWHMMTMFEDLLWMCLIPCLMTTMTFTTYRIIKEHAGNHLGIKYGNHRSPVSARKSFQDTPWYTNIAMENHQCSLENPL